MSWLKPIIIEDSIIPVWLSNLAPIEIDAISVGPFIICRGKLSVITKQHETIHFLQQVEMLFVFQWILYGLFYIIGRIIHGSGKKAYYNNPFEVEAYTHEAEKDYLENRKWYSWISYVRTLKG